MKSSELDKRISDIITNAASSAPPLFDQDATAEINPEENLTDDWHFRKTTSLKELEEHRQAGELLSFYRKACEIQALHRLFDYACEFKNADELIKSQYAYDKAHPTEAQIKMAEAVKEFAQQGLYSTITDLQEHGFKSQTLALAYKPIDLFQDLQVGRASAAPLVSKQCRQTHSSSQAYFTKSLPFGDNPDEITLSRQSIKKFTGLIFIGVLLSICFFALLRYSPSPRLQFIRHQAEERQEITSDSAAAIKPSSPATVSTAQAVAEAARRKDASKLSPRKN